MKGKSVPARDSVSVLVVLLLFLEACFVKLRRRIGGGEDDDVAISVLSDERGCWSYPNSKFSPSLDSSRCMTFSFPLENSLASCAVSGFGASRCTKKRPDDWIAFNVSDGRLTLNETTGWGWSVTVLNEDAVIPRNFTGDTLEEDSGVDL